MGLLCSVNRQSLGKNPFSRNLFPSAQSCDSPQRMEQEATPHSPVRNRPRNTPARALGLFCIGFAAVTAITVVQHRQRAALETTEARTAVGDDRFYNLRRPIVWERPLTFLESDGQEIPLYLVSEEPIDLLDHEMQKVAWPKELYYIYHNIQDDSGDEFYYIKVEDGRYLRLSKIKPTRHS